MVPSLFKKKPYRTSDIYCLQTDWKIPKILLLLFGDK